MRSPESGVPTQNAAFSMIRREASTEFVKVIGITSQMIEVLYNLSPLYQKGVDAATFGVIRFKTRSALTINEEIRMGSL